MLIATKLVIAFKSGPVFLRIPRDMTFAEVSERVESFAKWHEAPPLSVDIRFDASNSNGHARALAPSRPAVRRGATCAERVMASRFGRRSVRMLG
jgi:hypothetical protein